jgi:hypothetical protein
MLGLILHGSALASGFGGVDVNLVGEFDTGGSEFLVDVAATPLRGTLGEVEVDLISSSLSWGILPRTDRLDRLNIIGISGQQVFGSDTVAGFWLGNILYDNDFRMFELGLAGGNVSLPVGSTELDLTIGGDVRMRDVGKALGEDWSIFLGLPVGVDYRTALPGSYTSLRLGLSARPSIGLLGQTAFAINASGSAAVEYRAIAEESLKLDFYLENRLGYDSFTGVDLALEDRLFFGMSALF